MTETTTEAPATPTFKNEMQRLQFELLQESITKRNALVGKANAAKGDRVSLMEQIRENSTDPEIVEAREQMSKWKLALDALVDPEVERIIADSAGSVEGIEEEIKNIDSELKPGLTYYKKLYSEEAAAFLPSQERLKGSSVRSTSGGGRRIKGFNVIVTIDGESAEFNNFATAAKHLAVDTTDLQAAFFDAAGTNVLKDVKDVVDFVVNFVEVDDDENETEKEAIVRAYREDKTDGSEAPAEDATESADADEDVNLDEVL